MKKNIWFTISINLIYVLTLASCHQIHKLNNQIHGNKYSVLDITSKQKISNHTNDNNINKNYLCLTTEKKTKTQQKQCLTNQNYIKNPFSEIQCSTKSLNILKTIYEKNNKEILSQLGIQSVNNKNIINIGIIERYKYNNLTIGYNLFYDADVYNKKCQRLGIGGEYWNDPVRIGINKYYNLTSSYNIKTVNDIHEDNIQQVRVACGYDIFTQTKLPLYKNITGKIKLDNFALSSSKNKCTKNIKKHTNNVFIPYNLSIGINYYPIPLLTFEIYNTFNKFSNNQFKFNILANYQFNEPLTNQIQHNSKKKMYQLPRLNNFVERNNNIIIDYKKTYQNQQYKDNYTESVLTGDINEIKIVKCSIQNLIPKDNIHWDDNILRKHGGKILTLSPNTYAIYFPNKIIDETIIPVYINLKDTIKNTYNTQNTYIKIENIFNDVCDPTNISECYNKTIDDSKKSKTNIEKKRKNISIYINQINTNQNISYCDENLTNNSDKTIKIQDDNTVQQKNQDTISNQDSDINISEPSIEHIAQNQKDSTSIEQNKSLTTQNLSSNVKNNNQICDNSEQIQIPKAPPMPTLVLSDMTKPETSNKINTVSIQQNIQSNILDKKKLNKFLSINKEEYVVKMENLLEERKKNKFYNNEIEKILSNKLMQRKEMLKYSSDSESDCKSDNSLDNDF